MLALRRAAAGNESRDELRALAAEFPGALRELDRTPTEELERRLRACEGDGDGVWVAWMARYHVLVRAALAAKRGGARSADGASADVAGADGASADVASADVASADASGARRINDAVFAQLERETGVAAADLRRALFPPRR
jgi:hypothetical protein